MLSLHKIWRGKTGLFEDPQRKNWNWKNLKRSILGCLCPALKLKGYTGHTAQLKHPTCFIPGGSVRWKLWPLPSLQVIVRISAVDKDETSPRGFFRYSLATEDSNFSLIENYGRVSLQCPPQLPEQGPRAQGTKAAALACGCSSWAK